MSGENIKFGVPLDKHAKRDAVHVAILPVIAETDLKPIADIGVIRYHKEKKVWVVGANSAKKQGYVNPYHKKGVKAGTIFYMWLYQDTVIGLRHHYIHPDIPESAEQQDDYMAKRLAEARAYVQNEADAAGLNYNEIMEAAAAYLMHDDYLCEGARWDGHGLGNEFWDHYQLLIADDSELLNFLQQKKDKGWLGGFFSCSC